MRKARVLEADRPGRNQPRQDFDLELARPNSGIPLRERPRLVWAGSEDVQPTESSPRLAGQRPGGQEAPALVKRCEMAKVRVLKLGSRRVVQLRCIRRREEQDDRELIELHTAMLMVAPAPSDSPR